MTQLWDEFLKLFETLQHKVEFWLFQMPANFKFNAENLDRVRSFFNSQSIQHQIAVRKKVVIEFRDPSWWNDTALEEIEKEDILFCSVDAPSLPNTIVALNGAIYLDSMGPRPGTTIFTLSKG